MTGKRHDPTDHDCKGGVRGDLYPLDAPTPREVSVREAPVWPHRVLTCSCAGRRWVEDENWQPDNPIGQWTRQPHDGLIPCGFCNEGGWDTPEYEDVPGCAHDGFAWPCPSQQYLDGIMAALGRLTSYVEEATHCYYGGKEAGCDHEPLLRDEAAKARAILEGARATDDEGQR